ncbi:hypothetical protein V493_08125 [Pseudogymnoascus sp. VKM F-4281 (FW-2241)]|nr:hypothetical protein V493_08125 [Pseudogymnoascus sp. VKM F-4281 (FW-2241)]
MAQGGVYAAFNARYCEEDKYAEKLIYPHLKELLKAAAVSFPVITTMRLLCINQASPGSHEICYNVLSEREVLLPVDVPWDSLDWDDVDARPVLPPRKYADGDDSDDEAFYRSPSL